MDKEQLLRDAQAAPAKPQLADHADAVRELRQKGYSWREVAEFLNERGVQTDHTRVYRTFGETNREREVQSRPVDLLRITFLGQRLTKRKKSWNVVEIDLPSRFNEPITVTGYAWGTEAPTFAVGEGDALQAKDAVLVIKSGGAYPMAYIQAQILTEAGEWSAQEVYVVPKWEALL